MPAYPRAHLEPVGAAAHEHGRCLADGPGSADDPTDGKPAPGGQPQRRFVGKRLETRLHSLTCDNDWWIVAHDKLVCYAVLQAAGFPVPRTRALYRSGAAFGTAEGMQSLPDRKALAAALRGGIAYPLFGKPVRGIRSVGVLSIDGYDGATDRLQLAQGEAVAVDEVLDAVGTYAGDGYLLQERITQHPEVEAICGAAIATVRLIVLLTPAGRVIHRALWKLATGSGMLDAPFRAFLHHCARERGLERQLAKLRLDTL